MANGAIFNIINRALAAGRGLAAALVRLHAGLPHVVVAHALVPYALPPVAVAC